MNLVGASDFGVQMAIEPTERFGKSGSSSVRAFHDVDGDGQKELIIQVGAEVHFAAIDLYDGNVIWEQVHNTTKHKWAYSSKIVDGKLFHGSRANDTVYAINLSDGSLAWSKALPSGFQALEHMDQGIVYGCKGGSEVGVLDFDTGTQLSGWPISFPQHAQILGTGDLDGDGAHEVVVSDSNGNIEVHNADASTVFTIASSHSHVDRHVIADIDPTHAGRELLTIVDDDNSAGTEGDELVLYDAAGNQLRKYEFASGGPSFAIANLVPDTDGLEIFYGLEGTSTIGMLDGTLSPQWSRDITNIGSNPAGQTALADIDGDGTIELFVNTDEQKDGGMWVFKPNGNYVGRFYGIGWNQAKRQPIRFASPEAKRYPDIDGDGRDEVNFNIVPPSNTTDSDVINIIERA